MPSHGQTAALPPGPAPTGLAEPSVRLSWTLSVYLGRQVLYGIGLVVLAFALLAFVIDTIELLRRAGDRESVGLGVVLRMAALHLPFLLQKMLPFAMLFGAMLGFMRLTRSQELVAARAVGVSVWQFLTPALAIALLIGGFTVTVFNPLSAAMFARYERLEQAHLGVSTSQLTVAGGGLWLRQSEGGEEIVFHGREVRHNPLSVEPVTVFVFRDEVVYERRIDAASAELRPGHWLLHEAVVTGRDGTVARHGELLLPTDLSPDRIREGFPAPETVSFWDLPDYIDLMEAVGFSALEHRLHWHALLALPLLLCAMLLIGTTFSLRFVRRGGSGLLLAGGLVTGFSFYILSDIVFALGLSGRLPIALAAWTPAGIAVLLGLATLFHLEDG
jgi:lipopolysaccharide export system permease protein